MRRILSVLGIATFLAVAITLLWGARFEVARDKLLRHIDALLGETEVRKKEIDLAIRDMDKAIGGLSKGRINASVKAERLESQRKETEQKIAELDSSLRRLKEYLNSASPVEIAGMTYTQDQIKALASRVIEACNTLSSQAGSFELCRDRLVKIAATLEAREQAAQEKLGKLKARLSEIETELVALNAYREAAKVAGDSDTTFAANFETLERKVATLHDKVKTETRFEEEKWKAFDVAREVDSVASIIAATKSSGDIRAEIAKVLGDK